MSLTLPACRTDKLEALAEALAVLDFAKAQAAKQARHLQHPQLCLEAIEAGVAHGGMAGLKKVGGEGATRARTAGRGPGGGGRGQGSGGCCRIFHTLLINLYLSPQNSVKEV